VRVVRTRTGLLKSLHVSLLSVATMLAFVSRAPAQSLAFTGDEPGSIAGTVTDPNGGSVPGATVVVQGSALQDTYTGVANDKGFFELRNIRPGIAFRVVIHAETFANWSSPPIVLAPAQYKLLTECKLQLEEVRTTVDVSYSSVQVATEQVAAQEKQRLLGLFPNFYVNYDPDPAPMTAKLKFKLALKVAVDPVTILGVAFIAGLDQAGNTPDFQQGAKGYGQRFGAVAADGYSDIIIGGAILPSLLHQDPRYFYQGKGTTKSRVFHAITFPFACRGDNGQIQPNYSSIGGDLAASALENTFYPRSNRGPGLVFGHFALDTAERAVSSLAQEFLFRRLTPKAKHSD
jgi:Carboxypeptidase regulatory-like domain